MNPICAVFPTYEIFTSIKDLGPLPSGVILGMPRLDYSTPRCCACHYYSEDDVAYLLSFSGVYTTEGIPTDWTYEPSED